MGVDIYYFYHGFGLKAFEGRHNRIVYILLTPLNDGVSLRVYFIIFSFPYILLTSLNDGVSLRVYFIIFSFPSVVTSPKRLISIQAHNRPSFSSVICATVV